MECDKCCNKDLCDFWKSISGIEKHFSNGGCGFFKDKATIVELPAALETNVWCVANPCSECEYYETVPTDNEKSIAEYIKACQNCNRFEIIECKFDYELIPEIGKMAFLTKEAAEKRLEELRNDCVHK